MYSNTSTGKASKGSVTVGVNEGRLRIQLPRNLYDGKQKYMSLAMKDTPENRQKAEAIASAIQADLEHPDNLFDHTLEKYKPKTHLTVVEAIKPTKPSLTIKNLWAQYLKYKEKSVSPSTIYKSFGRVTNALNKLPSQYLDDAVAIRDWLLNNYTPDSVKRTIVQLNACCNWALSSKLIDDNPFDGMASHIKIPKSQLLSEIADINPFTKEERDAIIETFKTNQLCSPYAAKCYKHSNYTPYIEFLFFTGCRSSEAIALQWKHVTDRYVIFEQAVVDTENGRQLKEGLKTQKSRRFPINNQLRSILDSIKPENAKLNDLVFPSPKGGYIDPHNFRNKIWKPIIDKMGIPYRKPYQTRHTFITLCLESGMPIQDVARISGNSPDIILKHYAGNRRDLQVPEL